MATFEHTTRDFSVFGSIVDIVYNNGMATWHVEGAVPTGCKEAFLPFNPFLVEILEAIEAVDRR